MEKLITFLCLAVVSVFAQELPPLTVTISDPSPRFVSVKDTVSVQCTVNRDIIVLYSNHLYLELHHDNGDVTLLYDGMNRKDAPPSLYDLERVEMENKDESYILKFLSVGDQDEGKLVCRFEMSDGSPEGVAAASVDIHIMRQIESVSLKFDNDREISASQEEAIQVDSGTYSVMCTARGSNPAVTNLKLYLHNEPIEAQVETVRMETEPKRFQSTVTANIDIKVTDSKQTLECTAEQPFDMEDDATQLISVAVPIKVNNYDPVIKCEEAQAYSGMMYPKLTCLVDHTGLDIKEFRYLIKSTGKEVQQIAVGQKTADKTRVESKPEGPEKTQVTLELYMGKDWHFDNAEFFLEVENQNGHVAQVPVTLREIKGLSHSRDPNGGSALVQASMTCLLLCTALFALLRLQ